MSTPGKLPWLRSVQEVHQSKISPRIFVNRISVQENLPVCFQLFDQPQDLQHIIHTQWDTPTPVKPFVTWFWIHVCSSCRRQKIEQRHSSRTTEFLILPRKDAFLTFFFSVLHTENQLSKCDQSGLLYRTRCECNFLDLSVCPQVLTSSFWRKLCPEFLRWQLYFCLCRHADTFVPHLCF